MLKLLYIGFVKKAIIIWIKKKIDRIRKGLLRIYLIKGIEVGIYHMIHIIK